MVDKDKDDDKTSARNPAPAAPRTPKPKISDAAWNSAKAKFIDMMRIPEITQSTAGWNHLNGHIDEMRRFLEEEM